MTGINVLMGANGAGKSTVLEAIYLAASSPFKFKYVIVID